MSYLKVSRASLALLVGALATGNVVKAQRASSPHVAFVESAACVHAELAPTVISTGSQGVGGSAQTITVDIPATVFLRIDKLGRVTEAATNTGCHPRHGDDVYLFAPDGSVTLTKSINLDSVTWFGDFSLPGEFQPQPHD